MNQESLKQQLQEKLEPFYNEDDNGLEYSGLDKEALEKKFLEVVKKWLTQKRQSNYENHGQTDSLSKLEGRTAELDELLEELRQ